MTDQPAVLMEGVNFSYGTARVLEDVTFRVERGGFVALIGPNGGGKSTLIRLLLGFLRPDSGTIRVFGRSPVNARRFSGYVPQLTEGSSFPVSALEVVLMGRLRRAGTIGPFGKKDRNSALDALELMGIRHLEDQPIGMLSGGQQQRVLIARALVGEPELLLLDEPVASVDSDAEESFYNTLSELNSRMTIIMATHDIGAVSSWIRTVACLNRRLFSHGESLESDAMSAAYGCPFELVTHGVPHRVLERDGKSV